MTWSPEGTAHSSYVGHNLSYFNIKMFHVKHWEGVIMEYAKEFIMAVAASAGFMLGALFGPMDNDMITLCAVIALDYITGVLVAAVRKNINSEVGWKGITKKVLYFVMVALANVIDTYVVKAGGAIRTAVVYYYVANEGISIVENMSNMGIPVPKKIKDLLEQVKDEKDS